MFKALARFLKSMDFVYNLIAGAAMSFEDIVGNARIKNILQTALRRGRIPNSLLLTGPHGVGKIDVAYLLAKALNCLDKDDDACGRCPACSAIDKGTFPDVMHIAPEKDILKIDQIRDLKEAAYLKPMIGKKRVFIIEQAEKMNHEAANSLLKVLEEPPHFSYIILVTSNLFLLLPTIKSRCQILGFAPISREDIEHCLLAQGVPENRARILSLLVRGNLKQAMQVDWKEVRAQREEAWELFHSFLHGEPPAGFLKEYSGRSRGDGFAEKMFSLLELLASFCRDLLLLTEQGDSRHLLNPDFETRLRDEVSSLRPESPLDLWDQIERAHYALQRNVNIKLFTSSMILSAMGSQHV